MSTSNFVVRATINDVYIRPKNKFRIPRFQRQYTWEEKQIEEFWDTINSDKPVFIGTIIFNVKELNNSNIIEIIDGQQRYLTIQILGAAIRDIILKEGKAEKDSKYIQKAKGLNARIIGEPDVDDDEKYHNYLITGDSIKKFFKKHIQNNPPVSITESLQVSKKSEEEKVKKAYLKFQSLINNEIVGLKYLQKYEWLKDLVDDKLSKHFFVKIEIDDENLAYEIFESVNAKGIDLSVADLIKNQIFKNVVGNDDKYVDSAKGKWAQILENLERTNFSLKDFLSYYWSSRYEYVSDKKLYSEIKEKFKLSKKEWGSFLDSLVSNSNYLNILLNGGFEDILEFFEGDRNESLKVYNSLRVLRNTKAKTWIILYLCLFRNLDSSNPKRIKSKLSNRWQIIEKFTFLYFQILSLPGNWYFSQICDFCEKVEEKIQKNKANEVLNLFTNVLYNNFKQKIPSSFSKDFIEGFKSIEYRDEKNSRVIVRYILNEIEEKIGGKETEGYNEEKVNIEHILPRDCKEWKVTKKAIKPYVNTLGNLTLISKDLNGKLENRVISEKLQLIKDSKPNLKLVLELIEKIESKHWDFDKIRTEKNFEAIEKRLDDITRTAHDIWCVDLKSKMGF
jgi:uncharacterized protein with ParB-like and HNH nuclease domain